MSSRKIYELTSIARPVEPQYATNKAVLILLPAVAGLCALYQILGPGDLPPVSAAVTGALAAFAAWALTRELAPDDNPAAFISMALGVAGVIFIGVDTVLPTFVALFLVRIVNRSVGKPATRIDSLLVLLLAVGAGWSLGRPALTWIGAAAFLLDARLAPRLVTQMLPAAVCLLAPLFWQGLFVIPLLELVVPDTDPQIPRNALIALMAVLAVLYAVAITSTREIAATGDATGEPLLASRVRAGMLVGFLVTFEGSIAGGAQSGGGFDPLLWSCIAGVGIGNMLRLIRQ